jgi:RNA polymerase sigma factor (sigma-70 family)
MKEKKKRQRKRVMQEQELVNDNVDIIVEKYYNKLRGQLINFVSKRLNTGDKINSQDLVQEACFRILKHTRKFGINETTLPSLFFTVLNNEYKRYVIGKKQISCLDDVEDFLVSSEMISNKNLESLTAMNMDATTKSIIGLRMVGYNNKEISDCLKIPIYTVNRKLYNIREKVRRENLLD